MKLKEIVFSKLNLLLNAGHLQCHFLSKTDSIYLLQYVHVDYYIGDV